MNFEYMTPFVKTVHVKLTGNFTEKTKMYFQLKTHGLSGVFI